MIRPCSSLTHAARAAATGSMDRVRRVPVARVPACLVVLAGREAVLTHEHMSACAPSGFRSSRTKKSGCPLTFLVVKGVLYSGASGQGSHARVRHGPRGSDKPRLLGASLHDAGGRRYAIPVRGRSRRGSRARSERSELDSSWAAGGDPRISTGTTPGVDTGNGSTAGATDQLSFKASPLVGSRALPCQARWNCRPVAAM